MAPSSLQKETLPHRIRRESFVTISQQYPTSTQIAIEYLKAYVTILCLGVKVNACSCSDPTWRV